MTPTHTSAGPPYQRCPACQAPQGIPVLFGYPSHVAIDKARQGLVAFGGCTIFTDDPVWNCKACRHEWSDGNTHAERKRFLDWVDQNYDRTINEEHS